MKELEQLLQTKSEIPLARKTLLNIFYTSMLFKDVLSNTLKPFDISVEQFNVLRILRGQHPNALNLQDIQERMISKMSNTTRLVDKLILKTYVERFTCEKNRRKVEIFITEEGLKLLSQLDPIINKTEEDLINVLSHNELETINNLINKLRS
ncbi:MarR family winged helix-turn-helix transcriptional regulator [Psychroserpens mesophilus]|jgi:DNA-binding MarR family transcriptional regulator|uniref:MarR family winged helix-turn-helix transcriptional regulator n=1 Tax=Psychroserpens mesophilus TaxID=325473 RepID=UPI00058BDB73|nr:MarR family transcriptional regulator [Psychroserpens mesophilus]